MKEEKKTDWKSKAHHWSWLSGCIGGASVLPQGPSSRRHPCSQDTGPDACYAMRGPWRTQHRSQTAPYPPVRTESLDWFFPHLTDGKKRKECRWWNNRRLTNTTLNVLLSRSVLVVKLQPAHLYIFFCRVRTLFQGGSVCIWSRPPRIPRTRCFFCCSPEIVKRSIGRTLNHKADFFFISWKCHVLRLIWAYNHTVPKSARNIKFFHSNIWLWLDWANT